MGTIDIRFIDWLLDLKPSRWCLYANAYAIECFGSRKIEEQFEEFLYECYKREENK
jgi:hypothetical protein|tara:strand:+ start:3339 stop:3506 length:168 start_codon:yes stop_codon:yes gene_type:complete